MTDLTIVIERKRHDERCWIRLALPTGNAEQQYRVVFEGEEIGVWRIPEHEAARWLLAQGKAERADPLRTRRLIDGKETPSMTGSVGWFADHTVTESDKRGGTRRFIKWRPMPEGAFAVTRERSGTASEEISDEG
jgi:hypothetical protein